MSNPKIERIYIPTHRRKRVPTYGLFDSFGPDDLEVVLVCDEEDANYHYEEGRRVLCYYGCVEDSIYSFITDNAADKGVNLYGILQDNINSITYAWDGNRKRRAKHTGNTMRSTISQMLDNLALVLTSEHKEHKSRSHIVLYPDGVSNLAPKDNLLINGERHARGKPNYAAAKKWILHLEDFKYLKDIPF